MPLMNAPLLLVFPLRVTYLLLMVAVGSAGARNVTLAHGALFEMEGDAEFDVVRRHDAHSEVSRPDGEVATE